MKDWFFLVADFGGVGNVAPEVFSAIRDQRIAKQVAADDAAARRVKEAADEAARKAQAEADAKAERERTAATPGPVDEYQPAAFTAPVGQSIRTSPAALTGTAIAPAAVATSTAVDEGAVLSTGELCKKLAPTGGLILTVAFIEKLGFAPAETKTRTGVYWRAIDFKPICAALVKHIEKAAA